MADANIPKNHHYVPRTYISGFANAVGQVNYINAEGILKNHRVKVRTHYPKGLAYKEHFYKIEDTLKSRIFDLAQFDKLYIEKVVNGSLENKYENLKLLIINEGYLKKDDADDFLSFIINLKTRNPSWLKMLNQNKVAWTDKVFHDLSEEIGTGYENIPEQIAKSILKQLIEYELSSELFSKNFMLHSLIDKYNSNSEVYSTLLSYKWHILVAPNVEVLFISTDNPGYSISNGVLENIKLKGNARFYFPIDSHHCFYASDEHLEEPSNGEKILHKFKITPDFLHELNLNQSRILCQYAFGKNAVQLETILKHYKSNLPALCMD